VAGVPLDELILSIAVFCLAMSQVFQKLGAVARLRDAGSVDAWVAAFRSPQLLAAMAFIVAGTMLWLVVLYRMDLSRAYPFLGVGTILVVTISHFWLHEKVSASRWLGVLLIAAGISMVAGT
jgi:drug/metabolite transporter (DMT)-like permease